MTYSEGLFYSWSLISYKEQNMIEMLMAMNIVNEDDYTKYREGITPLLNAIGGGFRYDFKIAEVLKSESTHPINRVFAIYFPNKEIIASFFEKPEYIEFKNKFYVNAVESKTTIATYER